MNVLATLAVYTQLLVHWAYLALQWAAVIVGVLAFVDVLRRPADHFVAAGKRTKGFWMGVNAAGFIAVILLGSGSMLGLLGFVANAVYLADVRPALDYLKPVRVRSRVRRTDGSSQTRPNRRDGRGGRSGGDAGWRR